MDEKQKKKLLELLPVLAFIAAYFTMQLFDWMQVTQVIVAMLISLLTFFFMAADLKEEGDNPERFKTLNFYIGLLSFLFVIFFLHGFLHWNRMIPNNYRMGIMFLLILVYLIALFRAIRILAYTKEMMEVSGSKGRK